ncbi:MAG TPA: chemotaxis protein CheA [Thermoanaerobaculia bacterium]|jgi:two-component system chemotaxis sensor kinase CheA|nr:chemotaxis protein CheA [Thermoanaerobaculia bacterium]
MRDEDRARQEFTGEAEELLDTLSRDLAQFESQGQNVRPELINNIFRNVHSLKGLAGMLGFAEISELSHNLEDMLDKLRMGKISISRDLVDLLYDSVDSLNRLIIAINDPSVAGLVDVTKLTSRIHQMVLGPRSSVVGDPLSELTLDEQTKRSLTEYEEHRLIENVRSGKHVLVVEVTFDFADFDEKLRAVTASLSEAGEVISTLPALDATGGAGISFRLLYGSTLNDAAIAAIVKQGKVRSLRKSGGQTPSSVRTGEAPVLHETEEDVSLRSLSPTVRVDIAKLDHVMNIVGELLIEKNQLANLAQTRELTKIVRELDRRLSDLQRSVIEMRMVPVGQIYSKLSRAVRKLARELHKEIELVLRGEDTELDKMMVEELTDPLMHIIRNALDHGIESAEERQRAGKPPVGRITLTAYQQGNSVVIDVRDDGRGIDPQKIRDTAVKRGLIAESEAVDAPRAYELLFLPAFSTASAVSEISGRGVGLDVVKKNIQDLKGSIEVISQPGEGTTFRTTLPITLAIIQALIVRAGGEKFAIPLTSVSESLRINVRDIRTLARREVFTLRDEAVPLIRLSDAFNLPAHTDEKFFVVVTRSGEKSIGILVDALVRQQEIVIKAVGERLKRIPGVAGVTEIGESEIVLVIDAGSLIDEFGGRARQARAAVNV